LRFTDEFRKWITSNSPKCPEHKQTEMSACSCKSDCRNNGCSLLPNEMLGHGILHAHCVTKGAYSKRALAHHTRNRNRMSSVSKMKHSSEAIETIGHALTKLKLIAAFAQCVAFLPVVFEVPWPQLLLNLANLMQIFTADIILPLMHLSCQIRSDYISYFAIWMSIIPTAGLVAYLANRTANIMGSKTRKSSLYGNACKGFSDQFFLTIDLILYLSYAGVCSQLFVYFRCRTVQGQSYLIADMRVRCYQGEWQSNVGWAWFFVVIYMFGIPMFQFLALCTNKRYLHGPDDNAKKHQRVKRRFGSLYNEYRKDCWWVRPLEGFHRLTLTGGVVLFGEDSGARLLVGILASVLWLLFVIGFRPYKASWDNRLAMFLAVELILTLVVGMALKLYENEASVTSHYVDKFQNDAFGFMIGFANVIALIIGVSSVLLSFKCSQRQYINVQERFCGKAAKKKMARQCWYQKLWLPLYNLYVSFTRNYFESSRPPLVPLQITYGCCGKIKEEKEKPKNTELLKRESSYQNRRPSVARGVTPAFLTHIHNTSEVENTQNREEKYDQSDINVLKTQDLMDRVKHCKVLFSFGSANGGLKLAKDLRAKLRQQPGWNLPSSAYIDCVDLDNGPGWKRHRDTQLVPMTRKEDNAPVLDSQGKQVIKVMNHHWAEFYYSAMLFAKVVVIVLDSAWRESKWCQGEWKLFMKHFQETFTDDQKQEQQAYYFQLIVVYDSKLSKNPSKRSDEKLDVIQSLIKFQIPGSLLEDVKLIPARIHGSDSYIEENDLEHFVKICRQFTNNDTEGKTNLTNVEKMSTYKKIYDEHWKFKALDMEKDQPEGHAYWWARETSRLERSNANESLDLSDSSSDEEDKQKNRAQLLVVGETKNKDKSQWEDWSVDTNKRHVTKRFKEAKLNNLAVIAHVNRAKSKMQKNLRSRREKSIHLKVKMKKEGVLKKHELFSKLKPESLDKLLKLMELKTYDADELLCKQKDEADRLFVLVSGSVNVNQYYEDVGDLKTRLAETIHTYTAGPMFYPIFGETSILQESVTYRNATLLVVEKCQTLELSKSAYFFLHEAGLLKNEVDNSGDGGNDSNDDNLDIDSVLRRQSISNQEKMIQRLKKLKNKYSSGQKVGSPAKKK
jgi:hypothetical protein